MQNELKIAIIQSDLVWENPEQNRMRFSTKMESIKDKIDLIVLPEMFTSGFTMNPERVAETMSGATVQWMKHQSNEKNAAILGSIVISEDGNFFNRLLFVMPNGDVTYYDKRHTFTLAGEHKVYEKGQEQFIQTYKGWRLCTLICYDLRFPVWARNTQNYDVLLYVANWPETRIDAWDTLLKARAIENMSYCIGVNRVGKDGKGLLYNGSSAVYDVLGNKLTTLPLGEEAVAIITLKKDHIQDYREKLKFLDDKDEFTMYAKS
ncbi:nitrilase family protein [Flavobacteriaceae bacterium MHTCC 0001]